MLRSIMTTTCYSCPFDIWFMKSKLLSVLFAAVVITFSFLAPDSWGQSDVVIATSTEPQTWVAKLDGQPVFPDICEGVSCLNLPYAFTATKRAVYDKAVNLNLSGYTHLVFKVNGLAALPPRSTASSATIYFMSPGGARSCNFSLSRQWQTIVFPLESSYIEGSPDWSNITGIRISIWASAASMPGNVMITDMRVKASTSTNVLLNGGFEITNTGNMPDGWGPHSYLGGLRDEPWVVNTNDWRSRWGVDSTVHRPGSAGSKSLRIVSSIDKPPLKVFSNWTILGASACTLSAWMKSDSGNLPVHMELYSSSGIVMQADVTVGSAWACYPFNCEDFAGGLVSCRIYLNGSGTLWIDDVQLEAGSTASDFQSSPFDDTINTPTVNRTRDVSDYPYTPGSNNVPTVSIDSNRRFLVDGKPFIPVAIGWDNTSPAASLPIMQEIAKAGFNAVCLISYPCTSGYLLPILNNAQACGLKVIFCAHNSVPRNTLVDANGNGWVKDLKSHPAIIAWYVYDEPHTDVQWNGTDGAHSKYTAVKAIDPDRPAFVNFGCNHPPSNWVGDIVSSDDYQIPLDGPVTSANFADYYEPIAANFQKPLWMWIQTNGYGIGTSTEFARAPTGPEEECMVYLSMIHGVRGLMYWNFKPYTGELWSTLRSLNKEVRMLTQVLSSTNAAPTVSANSPSIQRLSKSYEGKWYVIAVNESPSPVTAELTIEGAGTGPAYALFENRSVNVVNGKITDSFAGYQRHVYSNAPIIPTPVAYWKLDETSGNAIDCSGYGHNGTLNGPTWTPNGKVGRALSFNGTSDYVVADNVGVNTTLGEFNTVAFWMKWNGGSNQMPFTWNGWYDLWLYNGNFGINTGNNMLGIPFPSETYANQWVHVAVVFPNGTPDTTNTKLFINGKEQALTIQSGTATSRTATSRIFISMGWTSGYRFGGTIDDVLIFNRALTAEEVAELAAP